MTIQQTNGSAVAQPLTEADARRVLDAEFGVWPLDHQLSTLDVPSQQVIYQAPHSLIISYKNWVVKIWDRVQNGKKDALMQREMTTMLLAGDCAVPVLGRVFEEDKLTGFIMPHESPLIPAELPPKERRQVIDDLVNLLRKLHRRDVIHGDVKPANLLRCGPTKELRFCDFGCACLEGQDVPPGGISTHYSSPYRWRETNSRLTKADDLYAAGISFWEIYTGGMPFEGINEELLEDLIMAGLRPDISQVDDPEVAQLITSYLEAGPEMPDDVYQSWGVCTETEIVFKDCKADPPHTYRKIVKCVLCAQSDTGMCSKTYKMPQQKNSTGSLLCTRCHPVEYTGITE